jgi:hypothetical protein
LISHSRHLQDPHGFPIFSDEGTKIVNGLWVYEDIRFFTVTVKNLGTHPRKVTIYAK